MATTSLRPCGDFRTTYQQDTVIFDTRNSRRAMILFLVVLYAMVLIPILSPGVEDAPVLGALFAPFTNAQYLSLAIQACYWGIAALGLNILVGFTGQISLGHAAFFGIGAFGSAYLNNTYGIPVVLSIPLAGVLAAVVGLLFGSPAARIKGLYLAIATLAAQFIIEDLFIRLDWFTGGSYGSLANSIELFGITFDTDPKFFLFALTITIVLFVAAANLMRTRDGRAFVAVRDHYLSAEVMGINLTKYRVLSFGISSFYAGIGGALYGHYLGFVSAEGFTILLSIQFLGIIIIGGLGSVMGAMLGTIFMVLLPEVMAGGVDIIASTEWGNTPMITNGLAFFKEMAIGAAIILFLIFEPDGLAHRWRLIKAYWKLYPFSY
ncbi:branched-chain amino acid ABC transporter permease [Roseospira marina]|uniref:Branched-chain amino acid ABC transporter permease n=1 Tax=Roseospira marina TaxID=140057 RepID=A0A5M6IHK8_9PROT|nr:branched-chain amino acid ABC transporter permease [Roseospira marina]KAA5607115.1 branched-chain amino acid ABC transporter permease [Roseospira marina]MBB4312689.1 branched-chain amino acid transport system permease protein [Roseospira marina]MBB5086538.1 branched-chain amino acid transport system permease protein [Roseospira marina]